MDEDSETLVIPQLKTEYDMHGMEHLAGQCRVTCPVTPPHKYDPFRLLACGT